MYDLIASRMLSSEPRDERGIEGRARRAAVDGASAERPARRPAAMLARLARLVRQEPTTGLPDCCAAA